MGELQRRAGMAPFRCGDIVKHLPTGEKWIVAYQDGDELSWFGWPEGTAKACDVVEVERVSDEAHERAVAKWKSSKHGRPWNRVDWEGSETSVSIPKGTPVYWDDSRNAIRRLRSGLELMNAELDSFERAEWEERLRIGICLAAFSPCRPPWWWVPPLVILAAIAAEVWGCF